MSKLLDKLNRAAQGESKPFGFATSASKSALPQILTIAKSQIDVVAKTMPGSNIDAVLLSVADVSKAIDSLKNMGKELEPVIWGIEATTISKKEAEQLVKIGCDFILLKLTNPAPALMSDESLGKLIAVSPSIDDTLIRAMSMLNIDVVVINEDANTKTVTLERLMMYNRLAAIVQQPVLISLPINLAKENLEVLHDTGIKGLILDWTGTATDKKVAELKKAIDALPKSKPARNKKKRFSATLPSISGPSPEEDDDSEE
ncbi:hypothetical protein ACFLVR_02270 [Chloroflexota bacterium]